MNNPVKHKLREGQVTYGSWITIGHISIAEILSHAGFDWLVIDLEHSVITLDVAQQLIQVIEANRVVPLVRVGENNPNLIKRVMDAGAYGVIVPQVNTKQDAEGAVKAVKYQPMGSRGVGLARAQGYGPRFHEYASSVNQESLVIAQIEHVDAVNNLDSIFSVRDLDGCIIGPYDLSSSLGFPGQFEHPDVLKAIETVENFCKKKEVPIGIHVIPPDYREVLKKVSRGYTFLGFSLDILFLGNSCREQMKLLQKS